MTQSWRFISCSICHSGVITPLVTVCTISWGPDISTQNPIVAHHWYGQGHHTIFSPILPLMQVGKNPHDPLTQLNSHPTAISDSVPFLGSIKYGGQPKWSQYDTCIYPYQVIKNSLGITIYTRHSCKAQWTCCSSLSRYPLSNPAVLDQIITSQSWNPKLDTFSKWSVQMYHVSTTFIMRIYLHWHNLHVLRVRWQSIRQPIWWTQRPQLVFEGPVLGPMKDRGLDRTAVLVLPKIIQHWSWSWHFGLGSRTGPGPVWTGLFGISEVE